MRGQLLRPRGTVGDRADEAAVAVRVGQHRFPWAWPPCEWAHCHAESERADGGLLRGPPRRYLADTISL